MLKKGESQGSVYYDKTKKKWIAQYYEQDKETGKKIRRTKVLKTEDEAKKVLKAIMYQKSNPIYIAKNRIPLGELMKANIKRKFDMNKVSKGQYRRVNETIALIYRTSQIVDKRIDELTSEEIQTYLNSMKHYSNSYIKKIFSEINQAFTYASNKGYLTEENPMKEVIKPKSLKKDKLVRALTIEEQQAFSRYIMKTTPETEPYKNVSLIQMFTGMRVGEALALQIRNIDLKHNVINITNSLTTDEDGNVIIGDTTKTYPRRKKHTSS